MGTTPNRAYPYPDPLDPMRVTTDLRDLAVAFDTDLKAVQDTVHQRPMFRASASGPFPMGSVNPVTLPFDVMETNSGGALVDPISMPQDTFTPLIAGLWSFTSTVSYQARTGATSAVIALFPTFPIARQSTNVMPNAADGNRTLSLTYFQHMDGSTDTISALFGLNSGAPTSLYQVFSRSLTGYLLAKD